MKKISDEGIFYGQANLNISTGSSFKVKYKYEAIDKDGRIVED